MEHKIKSETSPVSLDVYNHNGFTQIRVEDQNEVTFQKYIDMRADELRQFIECLELLEKQLK